MARGIKVKCIEIGVTFPSCRNAARWLLSTGQVEPCRNPMKFKNPCLRDPRYAFRSESSISNSIQVAARTHVRYNGYCWELEVDDRERIIEERRNKEKELFTEIIESKYVDEKTREKIKKILLKLDKINDFSDFRKIPIPIWVEEKQTWILV